MVWEAREQNVSSSLPRSIIESETHTYTDTHSLTKVIASATRVVTQKAEARKLN